MKDLSVIIVNYRGWERLEKCLSSLCNIDDNRFIFEVIVIDNQSNDGRLSEFVKLFPQIDFITNSGNNGFANGCNLGAARSTGSSLLFLNPDTTVTADALFDMLEEVRVRPQNSIVTCRQVKEDGSNDRPYGKFLSAMTLTGWQRAIYRMFSGKIEDAISQTKHYIYPDWVSGSVLMIRRESFFRLGKWDEDYWMYFEDVDLCRRAVENNGEIVYLKSAVVRHTHGGSSRINREVTVVTKTEVHISRHVYISKHENFGKAILMHTILILNNMVLGLIPALIGLPLFFVKSFGVNSLTYFRLMNYYLSVISSGTWLSHRSVKYPNQTILK
ncbi:MAG TPA: glycosyltransferase family 2 protein [Prolixibacteraceae bacterium]